MPHRVRCFQSGGSLVITIPADLRRQLKLTPGSALWIGSTTRAAAVLAPDLRVFNSCRSALDAPDRS